MLKTLLTSSTLAVAVVMSGCAATESLHISSNASQKESIGLYNHTWVATQINGVDIKTDGPSHQKPAIQFDANTKRFSGADGCNKIFGSFESSAKQLQLGPIASTRMACIGNDNATLSRQYSDALTNTTSYKIKGHELQLLDSSGKALVSFMTVTQPLP
ncbi:hypothetical protein F991_00504 [Acinetobacter sp. CIP-A165]|uniref:META domain-containing protein n=1 Tax=Acinetobacter sp. CIP-A165 TaxID=40373 RepID=UPI0002CE00BA|nr:META domain-containing protein [Acinetobacter sp. CIP-A165]ENU31735.1 hypothetical protein F991_00504 [Acinetobacter sp. CIP-A165]